MASCTLAQLVTAAKTAANAQVGGAWSTTEWNDACNRSYEGMWLDILGVNSAFRLTTTTFSLTAVTGQSIALPADFMAVYKVVKDAGTANRLTIERAADEVLDGLQRTYRIEGNNIFIDPLELSAGTYQLRYNPTLVQMTAGIDMDIELGQFREYVELGAACAYLDAEESSSVIQAARFKVVAARLAQWAEGSRSSGPAVPRDVRSRWRGNRLYPY